MYIHCQFYLIIEKPDHNNYHFVSQRLKILSLKSRLDQLDIGFVIKLIQGKNDNPSILERMSFNVKTIQLMVTKQVKTYFFLYLHDKPTFVLMIP